MLVVLRPPERRDDDGGELPMSGCGCHGSAACLDLNMLGQCLLEDAMLLRSDLLLIDGFLLPSARQLWWFVLDRWTLGGDW